MKIRFLSTGLEQRMEATIGLLSFCFKQSYADEMK